MESGIRKRKRKRKRNTESVKEDSKRSICKKNNYISHDNNINKQIKKKTQMNKLAE